jgi:RNA polymerase sigma-70 factor (ECF subfamily)
MIFFGVVLKFPLSHGGFMALTLKRLILKACFPARPEVYPWHVHCNIQSMHNQGVIMISKGQSFSKETLLQCSDWELIRAWENGAAQAADELAKRYYRKVLNTCRRYFACWEDARDATQEVFVKILGERKALQFRGESQFWTWLFRVAVNTCKTRMSQHQKKEHSRALAYDTQWEGRRGVSPAHSSPEEAYSRVQALAQLQTVLAQLPRKYREVINLICLEEFSYQDAARKLKIPVGHLGVKLMRGKILLTKLHGLACSETRAS